ncbi:helix-turn-helix domain-containing protein [Streptomyces sp. NPDC057623]|uniref:helix-turn-helix domain-containing protein n=1 Tax=Streptomyces sp. NPDC057623 TaxID=3346187 RepID=UPI0036B4FB95
MSNTMTASGFGARLKERREQVKMDHAALAKLLGETPDTVAAWENGDGGELTLTQLAKIADVLGTSIGALTPPAESDLNNGVVIQLPEDRPILKGVRDNVDYYVYNCLVRTKRAPSLVPLVVDVLTDDPDEAKFNSGHAGNEFLFVLEGEIHMKWGDAENPQEAVLPTGASLFVEEHVPHAFTAAKGTGSAKLIAVNF